MNYYNHATREEATGNQIADPRMARLTHDQRFALERAAYQQQLTISELLDQRDFQQRQIDAGIKPVEN